MSGLSRIFVCVLAFCGFSITAAHAQECESALQTNVGGCNALLQDVTILQPRVGVLAAGGNPIAGASSTLGMRIGRVPRISLGARFTGANLDVRDTNLATSLNLDAGVGIFSGFALMPTVGGFASLDAVGSVGKLFLSDRISSTDPGTWALGLRLGVLRESFTAPGISVTGMYRRIGDIEYALLPPGGAGEEYSLTDNSVLSLRGTIGKRLFVFGVTAGVGYDQFQSDVHVERFGPLTTPTATFDEDGFDQDRMTVFVNMSWTLLILNLVAEGGWQEGGDLFGPSLPTDRRREDSEKSTYYGSLAVRLAL